MEDCRQNCGCVKKTHSPRFVVLTGGPGAGKTAVLEVLKKTLCKHVIALPEAAGILFGGGFWRKKELPYLKSAQRAIYHIQNQMELAVREEGHAAVVICDRGTLDSLAYWPTSEDEFWRDLKSSRAIEFARYDVVIHLRTPREEQGYNHSNPLRIETAEEAAAIDEKINTVWHGHPNRHLIESTKNFLDKIQQSVRIIEKTIPECCLGHLVNQS